VGVGARLWVWVCLGVCVCGCGCVTHIVLFKATRDACTLTPLSECKKFRSGRALSAVCEEVPLYYTIAPEPVPALGARPPPGAGSFRPATWGGGGYKSRVVDRRTGRVPPPPR